ISLSLGTASHRLVRYGRYRDAAAAGRTFFESNAQPVSSLEQYSHGLARLAMGIASAHLGHPEAARDEFDRARRHLREAGNQYQVGTVGQFEYATVMHAYFPEMTAERRQIARDAEEAFSHSAFALVHDRGARVRVFRALIDDGAWEEARTTAGIFAAADYLRVPSLATLAELDVYQGNLNGTRDAITAAMPLGPDTLPGTHYPEDLMRMQWIAAQAEIAAGRHDLASRWIDALQHWLDWTESLLGRHAVLMLRARYHSSLGDHDRAIDEGHRAIELSSSPRQPIGLMEAHRALGETMTAIPSKHVEAEKHLRQALALAGSFEIPHEIAFTEIALAELLVKGRDVPSAARLIVQARRRTEPLRATPALQRIERLESVAQVHRQPGKPIDVLSARELEILRLVAQGLTDAEIGDQLFISKRTVSGHLRSIYSKIGASSRTAATAFAYQHQVVSPKS
ncbi:MAG TPA: LuxR C-terminal-related transcriptional regulator, partial [Thermomicrobiales bacterium]|nr:LuxR C-terminal-related transcriptional regulator [Thermomicrobiales bacterium]